MAGEDHNNNNNSKHNNNDSNFLILNQEAKDEAIKDLEWHRKTIPLTWLSFSYLFVAVLEAELGGEFRCRGIRDQEDAKETCG